MESNLLFWMIAIPILVGAVGAVLLPNILHAALSLVGSFFVTAILFLVLQAEFVALAQVMVYIGGILIFIIFTILLTSNLGEEGMPSGWLRKGWALLLPLGVFYIMRRTILRTGDLLSSRTATNSDFASLREIGLRLLAPTEGGYIVTFEMITLLLLAALIGAIVLTRRPGSAPEDSSSEGEEK